MKRVVNTQYLEDRIKLSGKKKQYLADKIGCSRQYLTMKINNKAEFDLKEVIILCDELGVKTLSDKEKIFFCPDVTKNGDKK